MKKKWAVCGLGRITERFLKVAKIIDDIEVVAAASSDKDRAIAWCKERGIAKAYTYDELYKASGIDAVYVATNNHLHCPNVLGLIESGKAVLCEKPLALNATEVKQMLDIATKRNTLLMEAMWTKFLPCNIEVRDIVGSGKYGKVVGFEGRFCTSMLDEPSHRIFDRNVGGGSLLDLGVYPISYAYATFGLPNGIESTAELQNGVDVSMSSKLQYEGFVADVKASCVQEDKDISIDIHMQSASIHIPLFQQARQYTLTCDGKSETKEFEEQDGFYYEMRHFCDLLNSGSKESNIQTFADSKNVMDIMTTIAGQIGVVF